MKTEIVGERIKSFREFMKVDQETFSQRTGIPVQRLKKIEANKVVIKVSDIALIADAYHISVDYLLGINDVPMPLIRNEEEQRIVEALIDMTPEQRAELKERLEREMQE